MTTDRPFSKAAVFYSAAGVILVGDFVTKRIAEASLALHTPRAVIGEWVRFTLTYNTGAAMNFSLGDYSRLALSVVAVVMVFILYRMYRTAPAGDVWQALALGLVSGGALGNLADRIRSARGVVDFIDVGTASWRFWTFNVADTGVTVGAILLALIMLRHPEAAAVGPGSPAVTDAQRAPDIDAVRTAEPAPGGPSAAGD